MKVHNNLFEDNDVKDFAVIISQNGHIFVGGADKTFKVYLKDFQPMLTMGMNGQLHAMQVTFDKVFCSISESNKLMYIEVLSIIENFRTLYTIKT